MNQYILRAPLRLDFTDRPERREGDPPIATVNRSAFMRSSGDADPGGLWLARMQPGVACDDNSVRGPFKPVR
jgi:hypothetical protein